MTKPKDFSGVPDSRRVSPFLQGCLVSFDTGLPSPMPKNIGLLLLTVVFLGCGRIPSDFHQHTLPEKIAIYERHFRRGGLPNQDAEWSIAWHGDAAANAMIPYLAQQRTGLTVATAALIVQDVAATGCDLKGSSVETVLRQLSTDRNLQPYERSLIQITLSTIEGALPPMVPGSHYGFGACAKDLAPPPKDLRIKVPDLPRQGDP